MQIKKLTINNYRNLDGQTVSFADNCNFIVGENNLGKSNLLSIFQILFTNRAFKYNDFTDISKPIEITIQLKLEDIEVGHFEDLFDTEDYHLINITCKQITSDDNIEFSHTETNSFIHPSIVRCVNFIHYDSLRNPVSEINFDKGKGVGKFLSNIIEKYLEENELSDTDFINAQKTNELLESINAKISKLKTFSDFRISAYSDSDIESLLSKVIILKDEKGNPLTKSGYGVQFLILITLSILAHIQSIKEQRKEKGIFENETEHTKYISLIIGLDEPEIHLHPYMQRSLIKYLNNIISNNNSEFQELVKELFGIDGFNGQIIIATHSPNILLNDYTQIVRLYQNNGITKIKSGSEIVLDEKHSKRLHMHFPSIKEAFFSRCVIFVEGDSEESSFSHFAEKMSVDFDELGISVIQSRGGEFKAIKLLMSLAEKFDIFSVGIGDRDKSSNTVNPPFYLTNKKDFDEEIASLVNSKQSFLDDVFSEYADERALTQREHDISSGSINIEDFYIRWLSKNKSYPLGKLIGEKILVDDIPAIYKTVILKAEELSKL